MKPPPLEPSQTLVKLAASDNPPTDLKPYVARLRRAGATEIRVDRRTDEGVMFELSSPEQARDTQSVVFARSRRVLASWLINWDGTSTPILDALEGVTAELQGYDQIARFRFAASDMRLVAGAAAGLIDARDDRGPARIYERVIETGMVVTYARPFLDSNEAPIGRRWLPPGKAERELHQEVVDLRGEYHAHATHSPERGLEIMTGFSRSGRPVLAESWTLLPVSKLEALRDLATRQADRFEAEAKRLDLELFGPRGQ